jgi:hypothetical protein
VGWTNTLSSPYADEPPALADLKQLQLTEQMLKRTELIKANLIWDRGRRGTVRLNRRSCYGPLLKFGLPPNLTIGLLLRQALPPFDPEAGPFSVRRNVGEKGRAVNQHNHRGKELEEMKAARAGIARAGKLSKVSCYALHTKRVRRSARCPWPERC